VATEAVAVVAAWAGTVAVAVVSMVADVALMAAAAASTVGTGDLTVARGALRATEASMVGGDSMERGAWTGRGDWMEPVAWTMAAGFATSTAAVWMEVLGWTGAPGSMAVPGSMVPAVLPATQIWRGLPPWATGAFGLIR
jgi:hypothetical protein